MPPGSGGVQFTFDTSTCSSSPTGSPSAGQRSKTATTTSTRASGEVGEFGKLRRYLDKLFLGREATYIWFIFIYTSNTTVTLREEQGHQAVGQCTSVTLLVAGPSDCSLQLTVTCCHKTPPSPLPFLLLLSPSTFALSWAWAYFVRLHQIYGALWLRQSQVRALFSLQPGCCQAEHSLAEAGAADGIESLGLV